MDVIEFFDRTDHRNLHYNINFMVKQCMRERDVELAQKQQSLRDILECDNLVYNEKLVLLMRQRVEEAAQRRLDWIGTARIERERAEEELLKLKNEQRQLENCEEIRHMQSRQILLETKQAQLYQIEEKKALRRKEQHIERLWLEALRRLNDERQKQDEYARKLCKAIADANQERNARQHEEQKLRTKREKKALQEEDAVDNDRAVVVEKTCRAEEAQHERRKKLHQGGVLQEQMRVKRHLADEQRSAAMAADSREKCREDDQILAELQEAATQRLVNREWHKEYLVHAQRERDMLTQRDNLLGLALAGTGCVLQQQPKTPYGRQVR